MRGGRTETKVPTWHIGGKMFGKLLKHVDKNGKIKIGLACEAGYLSEHHTKFSGSGLCIRPAVVIGKYSEEVGVLLSVGVEMLGLPMQVPEQSLVRKTQNMFGAFAKLDVIVKESKNFGIGGGIGVAYYPKQKVQFRHAGLEAQSADTESKFAMLASLACYYIV